MSGGRGQNAAIERLVQLVWLLTRTPGSAVDSETLLRLITYGAETLDDRRRQLFRDIEQLRAAGWDIVNTEEAGGEARYRLTSGDIRLRIEFAPDEQAQLQRVARLADGLNRELAEGDSFVPAQLPAGPLDLVLHAVQRRCLLRFTYRGSDRAVHPHHVHPRSTGWYLTARESGGTEIKTFRLDRMSVVSADEPGTAEPQLERPRLSIDPISWLEDPPIVAQLDTTQEYRPQVVDLLGPPASQTALDRDVVRLEIPVTNRAAFRARLYELGTRVRLAGPPEILAEVRAELAAVAGAAS